MENKFRNELEIELAGEKILLRPTFENLLATELNVGSVAWLTWKYSRGTKFGADGKIDLASLRSEAAMKSVPPATEIAKIIYFNQAATKPDDPTLKKYSLEEIWEKMLVSGMSQVAAKVVLYLGRVMAGNKAIDEEEPSLAEKKS